MMIKICGLRETEHAQAAAEAGADLLGFVFAPTRRYIAPGVVAAIAGKLPRAIPLVGLFVDERPDFVRSTVEACSLAYAQLCGSESIEYCRALGVPFVRSFRVRGRDVVDEVERYAAFSAWCHLDAYVPSAYGGTGTSFDWTVARLVTTRHRAMVAGGLTPGNVGDAIRIAQPWGVDVSSGVETGGRKDVDKIVAFVSAARRAARALDQLTDGLARTRDDVGPGVTE